MANHQTKIQRCWQQASDENSRRKIGFVLSNGQSHMPSLATTAIKRGDEETFWFDNNVNALKAAEGLWEVTLQSSQA